MDTKSEIKRLIQDVAAEAAIAKAEEKAPWIKWPVIRGLFRIIVAKISDSIFGELQAHVDFVWIKAKTDEERKAYEKAAEDLKICLEQSESPDLEKAKEDFKNSLRDLIGIDAYRLRAR